MGRTSTSGKIEGLLWQNIEEFTGEALLPIRRQPPIRGGGKPDVVALDKTGRVVVIEVKRDVDRGQLAQRPEYAGWARSTSLDEIVGLYHRGPEAFFADWADFTESSGPIVLNPHPRLFLVAKELHARSVSAFDFLIESGVPVTVVQVLIYEGPRGQRLVDVAGEREPEMVPGAAEEELDHTRIDGRKIHMDDLLEHGLIEVGDKLEWNRRTKRKRYEATVAENGAIQLPDGRSFSSPSRVAMEATGAASYDGWYAWTVTRVKQDPERPAQGTRGAARRRSPRSWHLLSIGLPRGRDPDLPRHRLPANPLELGVQNAEKVNLGGGIGVRFGPPTPQHPPHPVRPP